MYVPCGPWTQKGILARREKNKEDNRTYSQKFTIASFKRSEDAFNKQGPFLYVLHLHKMHIVFLASKQMWQTQR